MLLGRVAAPEHHKQQVQEGDTPQEVAVQDTLAEQGRHLEPHRQLAEHHKHLLEHHRHLLGHHMLQPEPHEVFHASFHAFPPCFK